VRHGNTCPSCGSQERHRLFWLLAQPELAHHRGRRLYLAPEDSLRDSIAGVGTEAVTADLAMGDVDVRCDVAAMPLPDASMGLVICTDVLEHVPDDRAALAEIQRVLEPHGRALVHVPILTSGTVEYGRAVPADNEHVRAYGPDVVERFVDAGLSVDWRLAKRLAPRHRRRFGLYDEDVLLVARAVRENGSDPKS
jgi:SAM-dependent methyltransferase